MKVKLRLLGKPFTIYDIRTMAVLLLMIHPFGFLKAQTLQVVTKTIEKTFADNIEEIQIQAERANIEITTWNKPEIRLVLELTSKHPDKNIATNDLAIVNYAANKSGKVLYINNYLLLTKATPQPQANLRAHYVLQVPAHISLLVNNSFGKVVIRGTTKANTLKTQFCNLDLVNLSGKINVETHFGELKLTNIDGNIALTTDHTDAWLKQIKGNCKIRAKYGKFEIDTDKTAIEFDIKTDKTELLYSPAFTLKNPK